MKKIALVTVLFIVSLFLINNSKNSTPTITNKNIAHLPKIIFEKVKLEEDVEVIKRQVSDLKLSIAQKKDLGERLYHIGKVKDLSAKQKIEIYKLAKQNLLEGNKYE